MRLRLWKTRAAASHCAQSPTRRSFKTEIAGGGCFARSQITPRSYNRSKYVNSMRMEAALAARDRTPQRTWKISQRSSGGDAPAREAEFAQAEKGRAPYS